jgi:hypothetical protein
MDGDRIPFSVRLRSDTTTPIRNSSRPGSSAAQPLGISGSRRPLGSDRRSDIEARGSAITTPCDFAPFGEEDLAEARSRLTRLAQLWRIRLHSTPEEDLDRAQGDGYTPREMAFCALESIFYAEAVGDLTDADRSLAEDRRF